MVLLALLLLVILLVLLVPVRYTFYGQKPETNDLEGNIRFSWLFRILYAEIYADLNGVKYYIKALGFKLAGNTPEEEKDRESAKEDKEADESPDGEASEDKADRPPQGEADEDKTEESPEGETVEDKADRPPQGEADEDKPDRPPGIESGKEKDEPAVQVESGADSEPEKNELKPPESFGTQEPAQEKPDKPKLSDRILDAIDGFYQKLKDLHQTVLDLNAKVESLIDKAKALHLDTCIPFTLDLLKRVLIHILPRKLDGRLDYGLDDGYRMGQITVVASALYPLYGDHVRTVPHFERSILTGHLEGKGRIRIGFLVWQIIRALLNRDMRNLIIKIIKKDL